MKTETAQKRFSPEFRVRRMSNLAIRKERARCLVALKTDQYYQVYKAAIFYYDEELKRRGHNSRQTGPTKPTR